MQLLVLSDSHGHFPAVARALDAHPRITAVCFLGDGAADLARAQERYPTHTFYAVRGNCDYGDALPEALTVTLGGQSLYLTHGYRERVKTGLLTLAMTARERGVAAALYGHTHLPRIDFDGAILLFNPGSIGSGSYGVLDITPQGIYPRIEEL